MKKKAVTGIMITLLMTSMLSSALLLSFMIEPVKGESGLVGYWKFDEGSGNTACDSSGNSNTGNLNNGPVWVEGRVGKALSFDGVDDYVRIEDSSSLDMVGQLTVEAWVCPTTYIDGSHIVSRCNYGGPYASHIYVLGIYGNGKVHYSVNPLPNAATSVATIPLYSWTHLAMTYDGSHVCLYINGTHDSDYSQTGPINTTSLWLSIGCKPSGPNAYFNGKIDDVKIYNRALSQEEIVTDMIEYEESSIIIGTTASITILDPAAAYDLYTLEVFTNIGEGLLKYALGTADIEYGIAENYTISPDGLNYTFKLRDGMYFTDGEPLDAAAVKWSIDRVIRLNKSRAYIVSNYVDKVEVVNTLTVRFVLKKAVSFFPALITTQPYLPVSSKSYPANATAEPTVGHYGPYKIESWIRDRELVLEANPDYYGPQPRSKYVIIKFFANATMMKQALNDGNIDVAWRDLSFEDIADFRKNPNLNVVKTLDVQYLRYLILCCKITPFEDERLRQAVAAAVNRTRISTEAYFGTVDPAYSLVPERMWSHIDAFKDEYGARNLTLSRSILTDVGYNETNKLGFEFWYDPRQANIVSVIKSDLEETGMMNVTLRSASWSTIVENMPKGIMPMFFCGFIHDYIDPDSFLTFLLSSNQSQDYGIFYNNTLMDSILDEASFERNMTRRTELYEDAQRLSAEDAPLVPLLQGSQYAVAKPNVEGIYASPAMCLLYYTIYKCTPSTRYPWPMFHHNLRHTGYTESPAPTTNKTQWIYTTGGSVASSPAVVDGRVYVGSDDWKVYCLDAATGTHIWNYTTGWEVTSSSPAVADGKVYIGSDDRKVYCLDAATGTHIWNYTTGLMVYSSPTVADGRVYVGSYDRKVYCLDAATGAHIWNYTTGSYVSSSPTVADGKVYIGSKDTRVYCLDATTGAHIWNYTKGSTVSSSPAVANGKVYVGSYGVYCLDASTGAHIWTYTIGSYVSSSPAVANGKVYIGAYDNRVYCLDASTGTYIWDYQTSSDVDSSPAVADGMVFIGSDDHKVYAFGDVIRVPEDFPTVQGAINNATSGATIIVSPGVYREYVIVNKPLTILGLKGSTATFDGSGSGIAFTLQAGASGSTIAGFVITNYAQAVFIDGASNCKIYDNIMTKNVNSGVAEGNNAANNFIYSNVFQANWEVGVCAINLTQYSTGTTIYNNTIILNSIGLNIESGGNTIYWNIFIDNTKQVNIEDPLHNSNTWDNGYPDGGNYWSNRPTVDLRSGPLQNNVGSDGINDTRCTIAVNNIDHYPLVKPFSPYDIGITNVIPSKTIIGQGFTLRIDLKILNYGIHNELFTVTVYADTTIMGTQTITLTARNSTTITFTWNTFGFVKGNYTIKALINPILDETDTADNAYQSWVFVTWLGDLDADLDVDEDDLWTFCARFIDYYEIHVKDMNCDFDNDCDIDEDDLWTFCAAFIDYYKP